MAVSYLRANSSENNCNNSEKRLFLSGSFLSFSITVEKTGDYCTVSASTFIKFEGPRKSAHILQPIHRSARYDCDFIENINSLLTLNSNSSSKRDTGSVLSFPHTLYT